MELPNPWMNSPHFSSTLGDKSGSDVVHAADESWAVRLRAPFVHERGFTLLELLLVIAILAVLASMLLPALTHAKAKAHAVRCLGHLKQLQLAWHLYAEDHEDRLPSNRNFEAVELAPTVILTWARGVMTFTPNNPDNTNTLYLTQGLLGRYTGSPVVFRCPSDRSVATMHGRVYPRVRTAAMNHWMGFENAQWTQGQRRFLRLADIVDPSPARAFVLTMQREDAIEDSWMRIDPEPGEGIVQWPESYHNRGANFAFADGHAERHRWRDPRTTPRVQRGIPLSESGFPLDRNPDAQWIRDHATSRARN